MSGDRSLHRDSWGSDPSGPLRRPSAAIRKAARRRTRLKVLSTVLAILILVFVAPKIPHGSPRPVVVPEELAGRWVPTDPRYAGRTLEFAGTSVVFRVGRGDSAMWYPVVSVERLPGGPSDRFRIRYAIEGGEDALVLYRLAGDVFELRNPAGVFWRRSKP
jgi:hypothetical protein